MQEKIKPNLYIVSGGFGKNIMFTSIFSKLHEKEKRKFVVQGTFPDAFRHNPYCTVLETSDMYFRDSAQQTYKNFKNIYGAEIEKTNYLKGETHTADAWAEMYDIKLDSNEPEIYTDPLLEEKYKKEILKLGTYVMVQFSGGGGSEPDLMKYHLTRYIGRDYNYGQEIINLIKQKYPWINIVPYGYPHELHYKNTITWKDDHRSVMMVLAKYCKTFITIDSSLMHMCSSKNFNKSGICLWGTTSVKMFGYEKNTNIVSDYPYTVEIDPKVVFNAFEQKIKPILNQ